MSYSYHILSAGLFLLHAFLFFSCSSKFSKGIHYVTKEGGDDKNLTSIVMRDGKKWTARNLNLKLEGSFCYNDSTENCLKYGRLYTWELAMEGCEALGEGWRLPTSAEWEQMINHYGGIRNETEQSGKEAYRRLISGGDSGLDILFGGTRDASGGYRRIYGHGFYWTATERDSTHSWFYNFGKGGQFVNRYDDGEKLRAVSVRCINE